MDEKLTMTIGEVAEGLEVSARSVRRMWYAGEMPAPVKLGALIRWRRADIQSWLAGLPTAHGEETHDVETMGVA